jgi:hypothetical protein
MSKATVRQGNNVLLIPDVSDVESVFEGASIFRLRNKKGEVKALVFLVPGGSIEFDKEETENERRNERVDRFGGNHRADKGGIEGYEDVRGGINPSTRESFRGPCGANGAIF